MTMTWNALDLLPFDHELNMGRPGVVACAPQILLLKIVICFSSSVPGSIMLLPPITQEGLRAAKKIVADIDAEELSNKQCMGIDQPVVMDAAAYRGNSGVLPRLKTHSGSSCADWKEIFGFDRKIFRVGTYLPRAFVSKLSDAYRRALLLPVALGLR